MDYKNKTLKLNTSNQNKLQEFTRMFNTFGIKIDHTSIDLQEIIGTPYEVVRNKATEIGEGIIIEDTSLDIEGETIGIEIKWLLNNIEQYVGSKAIWRVILGIMNDNNIYIYEGIIEGMIVPSRGNKTFGFDHVFEPIDATKTLAEEKPDYRSARYKAVEALCTGKETFILPILPSSSWMGEWQNDSSKNNIRNTNIKSDLNEKGPTVLLKRQPPKGRNPTGGLKYGEIE